MMRDMATPYFARTLYHMLQRSTVSKLEYLLFTWPHDWPDARRRDARFDAEYIDVSHVIAIDIRIHCVAAFLHAAQNDWLASQFSARQKKC